LSFDIYKFIHTIVSIYFYMILIYVLMSWLPNVRESAVGEFLGKFVEPYLKPFRQLIPPIGGMLDVSPIVALIALHLGENGLYAVLRFLGV